MPRLTQKYLQVACVLVCAFCRRSQHLKNLARDARCQEFIDSLPSCRTGDMSPDDMSRYKQVTSRQCLDLTELLSQGLHLEAKRTHDASSAQSTHMSYCAITNNPQHAAFKLHARLFWPITELMVLPGFKGSLTRTVLASSPWSAGTRHFLVGGSPYRRGQVYAYAGSAS